MAVVYISLGLFLLFKTEVLYLSQLQKAGLGVILLVYGLLRLYLIKKKRDEEIEDEDEE